MKQPFETGELKSVLEGALGFRLWSFDRLDGASALNFRAEREGDGMKFLVKCSPPERQLMFDHLVRHLDEMRGTKAVRRMFAEECPARFRGFNLICLSWCPGVRMFPDALTDGQLRAFLDEYQAFSAAMQHATMIVPHDPVSEWRARAWQNCRGLLAAPLRRLMARHLAPEEVAYCEKRVRTIHGDFHHGNFLFDEGRLAGVFDLEEFCGGYPADDIVRYFVCAAEHLRWYELGRLRRIRTRFATAVAHLPYPGEEWLAAIDGLLVRKINGKIGDRRPGIGQVCNLLFRARFYLSLKRIVRQRSARTIGPHGEILSVRDWKNPEAGR